MQKLLAAVLLTVALILLPLPSQSDEQGAGRSARSGGRRRSPNAPQVPAEIAAAAKSFAATGCDPSLWDHVYHKQRLVVVEKCVSVTGTIYHIKKELDGDDHIQLKLDPDFAKLLNDRNKSAQANLSLWNRFAKIQPTNLMPSLCVKIFIPPLRFRLMGPT